MNAQTNQSLVAGEFVKHVVPVLFDQVKTISGLDVQGVLRGEQLFQVRDASTLYAFQLDSIHVNVMNALTLAGKADAVASIAPALAGMGVDLTDIPVYLTDHQQVVFANLPLDLNFPTKVTAKSALGDVILSFSWSLAGANLVGPFSSFRCDLETTGTLNTLIGSSAGSDMDLSWLHNGMVMNFGQYMGEKGPELSIELGDAARGLIAMDEDETVVGDVPMQQVSSTLISMDMSALQSAGYYTTTTSVLLQGGTDPVKVEESVYTNPLDMPLSAKVITSTTYDYQTGLPNGYTKETTEMGAESDEDGDFIYRVEKCYVKEDADAEWGDPVSQDSTRIQASNVSLDKDQLMASMINAFNDAMQNGVGEDGVVWGIGNFEFDESSDGFVPTDTEALYMIRESKDSVSLVMDYMKPVAEVVEVDEVDEADYDYMTALRLSAGFNNEGVGVATLSMPDQEGEFTDEGVISAFYYRSNLMDNVANERVIQAPELKVILEGNQLRFEGSEATVYRIYNIMGTLVKTGKGDRASLAGLQQGRVYVVVAADGEKQAVMRFVK